MDSSSARAGVATEARGALVAVGIGVLISGLFAIGSGATMGPYLLHGGITGLLIYAAISLLERMFRRKIESVRSETYRTSAHVILFAAGGAIGWFAGMAMALDNLSMVLGARWLGFMFLTIAAVIAVGLLFRSFERLNARLREREWAEKELQIARLIQKRLLPPQEVEGQGYSLAARNLPAQIVAGDFYDFVRLDDGSVAVIVADVAGKGIGASLIMASVKAVLPFVAPQPVSQLMSTLNEKLLRELDRREFVALACCRFYPDSGRLELANAGFPDPYLLRDVSASPLSVSGTRLPLGIRSDVSWNTAVATLRRGDRVLFVSDGIPEAQTAGGEPLGYDDLLALVASVQADTPSAWLDAFLIRVREKVDATLTDDWTAVVIECR